MNFERAREIFNSRERIDVLHNGAPVWIEDLDDGSDSAVIQPLNGKPGSFRVPVDDLAEG